MRPRRLTALLLALAPSACGSGSKHTTPPIANFADFVATLRDDTCAQVAACGQYPDKATCLAALAADYGLGQLGADVSLGKTKFDGAAAAKCLDAGRSTSCSLNERSSVASSPACAQIFTGTAAAGSPCFAGNECVSALCDMRSCDFSVMCCAGTCAPTMAPIPLNGDCSVSGDCVSGTFCRYDVTTSTGTCVSLIAAGQPCSGGDFCAGGLNCVQTTPTTQSVCARLPTEGQACTGQCDSSTNFCDPATMKCAVKLAVGVACPTGGCVD